MRRLRFKQLRFLGNLLVVSAILGWFGCAPTDPQAPNPNASESDFAGTWTGPMTFTQPTGDEQEFGLTLVLADNAGTLEGTMEIAEEPGPIDISGMVLTGVFDFEWPNTDPNDPDCQDWNVPLEAWLSEDLKVMHLEGGGYFCGGESGTLLSVLTK